MEKKKIKVAHVIGMAINGGTEALWLNYYRNINRDLFQFDFLVESESKIIKKEEIEKLGGKVIIIPSYKNIFKYMKVLKKIFIENKYDIVHSNMNSLSVFPLKAAKQAKVKIRIAHSHSTSNKIEWKKNIIKNLLRPFAKKYSTHYFACSESAGRWLFGNKTYNKGEVVIINNAIDIDKFKYNIKNRIDIRKEYDVLENEMLIGNIGRMMPQKNQIFLIDAFYRYHLKNPKSKLMIINDGPLLNELKMKVDNLNISNSVLFIGPKSDVFRYYSAFDLFALPSLYEGLGIVVVEAQANGLTSLVSNFVPREVDATGHVHFLDLNVDDWVSDFNNTRRFFWEECKLSLEKNNYCIKKAAKNLENIYISLLTKA